MFENIAEGLEINTQLMKTSLAIKLKRENQFKDI